MPQSVLSFVEVLLALGLASIATTGALALLAAVDYQMEKVRLENLLGGQIRYDQEWLAGMSYASLSACVPAGSDAASFAEAVFFSKRPPPQFPWKLDVNLARKNTNTSGEVISVKIIFILEEPAPEFPRSENETRSLTLPAFGRRRF